MTIKHRHAEAYRLMTYECEFCAFRETIWNSRDGVTPFTIGCSHCIGGTARHVDWFTASYAPGHKPQPGERMFVDLTKPRALEHATAFVEYMVDYKLEGWPETIKEIERQIEKFAAQFFGDGGAPDLITVRESDGTKPVL